MENEDPIITFYAMAKEPPAITPAKPTREWMDIIPNKFAYRCLPLNIANAFGWDIANKYGFVATWNGGMEKDAIQIIPTSGQPELNHLVQSHFGSGVLTLHVGYLVQTAKGWNTLVTGPLNNPKPGVVPLSGIVETDWLPFTFTMNWKFTAPGTVIFEVGEPICTVIPVRSDHLTHIQPVIKNISQNPELHEQFKQWEASRANFNKNLEAFDPATVQAAWQKHYFQGTSPGSETNATAEDHKSRLRLLTPIDKRE